MKIDEIDQFGFFMFGVFFLSFAGGAFAHASSSRSCEGRKRMANFVYENAWRYCTCYPMLGGNPYCPLHGTPPQIITTDNTRPVPEPSSGKEGT